MFSASNISAGRNRGAVAHNSRDPATLRRSPLPFTGNEFTDEQTGIIRTARGLERLQTGRADLSVHLIHNDRLNLRQLHAISCGGLLVFIADLLSVAFLAQKTLKPQPLGLLQVG